MMRIKHSSRRSGFTMVEISISIAFIAVLAITIAVLTINLSNSYRRGLTLKEVNTVGSELLDDISSSISNSSAKSLSEVCKTIFDSKNVTERTACINDRGYAFAYFVNYSSVLLKNADTTENISSVPVQGGICSGTYSYLWNSGYFFNDTEYTVANTSPLSFTYNTGVQTVSINSFRLLKIFDPSRSVCIAAVTGKTSLADNTSSSYPTTKNSVSSVINIDGYAAITETPSDLLPENNSQDLALYSLYIDKPSEDAESRNLLYTGSFILATVLGGLNIKATGNYCATPDGYTSAASNLDYCAINKFNFAARATGE